MNLKATFNSSEASFKSSFGEANSHFNAGASYNGATFFPSVSNGGIISWTNDGGLPNPNPVNIKGEKGDKGDKGEQGERGLQGIKGVQGERGADGAKGDKGDKGDRGEQGIQGVQGIKGDKGEKGDKGDTGANGKDGVNGKDGANGRDGKDGSTPVLGVDYFTASDKAEIVSSVIAALPKYNGEVVAV